jgi:hypothetical protein
VHAMSYLSSSWDCFCSIPRLTRNLRLKFN